ncbi:histidinol-phosphate transaminase [Terriglobus sp. RCC_193]|uniref:pyridoxal phosphate-dependent aminotransferase n=1 Tax=Terriglobus sp. RCC_193 TaxID=3239218 RepID=UPI003523B1EC
MSETAQATNTGAPRLDSETWEIQPRRAILAMPEYHPPLGGRDALRLDFNENTHAPSPRVREALSTLSLESFTIYPERAPVEAKVAAHFGLKPEQVLLANGTDEGIHLVTYTFLEEGDECLFATPSFFMYDVNAMAMGAKLIRIQMDSTLQFPYQRMLDAITPKTKLIILCSPNNPTGNTITRDQIRTIAKAAPHAVILVDEAYFHFFGESVMTDLIEGHSERSQESPLPSTSTTGSESFGREPGAPRLDSETWVPHNILIARTFSKAYGLANLRVGAIAGPVSLINHLRKASSPYNVNGIALIAVNASVDDTEYIDWYVAQITEGRERIYRALDNMKVPYWQSHANFVLMHIGPRHKEFVDGMRARGVLVRDRSSDPGLDGCVRITIGLEDQISIGIAALRDTLAGMGWTPAEVNKPETAPKETPDYE